MVSTDRAVSVAVLRDAVRLRVEATSLRQAAAEVGVSFSGLRSFLAGTKPQSNTRRKLIEWFERQNPDDQIASYLQGWFFGMITEFPEELWKRFSQDTRLRLAESALTVAHSFFKATDRPIPEAFAQLRPEDVLRLRGELR